MGQFLNMPKAPSRLSAKMKSHGHVLTSIENVLIMEENEMKKGNGSHEKGGKEESEGKQKGWKSCPRKVFRYLLCVATTQMFSCSS